ncbi:Sel1 domain-containing protein [Vibrio ichthyoenteri ATCC 700023]|uniref:Sel1 domain-containing protein n=1 Tax=Vibrio ichthyoenteri ATCC 700023 TaxID=870968 RepID=F9S1Q3_9VIBR|nr:tetratricopeptide repeat protein [Vibrio ichthyoenteri]EGU41445.1 Sel1 domain-containing protein [Vibrio ichthyoenteri ATCC 700023]
MVNKLKRAGVTIIDTLVVAFVFSLFKSEGIHLSGIERYAATVSVKEARQIGFTLMDNKQYAQARAFFEPAAMQGDVPSQITLATLYYYDSKVEDHFKLSYQWFSKNSDHPLAQYYLSLMYHLGDYVTKNQQLSQYWQQKAAYQSLPVAQYNQAVMYLNNGQYAEAYVWASYARKNGFSRASALVKQAADNMTPQEKARAQVQYNGNKNQHIWQGESDNSFSALLEGAF